MLPNQVTGIRGTFFASSMTLSLCGKGGDLVSCYFKGSGLAVDPPTLVKDLEATIQKPNQG